MAAPWQHQTANVRDRPRSRRRILSVPLDTADYRALSGAAARQGKTIIDVAQDAMHAHAIALTRRAAS